jgi:hypothetical protein
MNCGAVIDTNQIWRCQKKEATMILKFYRVTGAQLAELQKFVDSERNIIVVITWHGGEQITYPCSLAREREKLQIPKEVKDITYDKDLAYRAVRILKSNPTTNKGALGDQQTTFSIDLLINEGSPDDPVNPKIRTPRTLILDVLDILELFPERKRD